MNTLTSPQAFAQTAAKPLIVDCHGHYTTEPKQLHDFRKKQTEAAKAKITSASQDDAKSTKTAAAQQQRRQRIADRERDRRYAPTNSPVSTESYRAYGYQSANNDRRGGFGFGW